MELPIPAASAVRIGGERAYKLARRGVTVEMPLRRSCVYALDVIAYRGSAVRLELHVSSGTYVRAVAEALGGHCTSLRRTAVGPFRVEEADPERLLPVSHVLLRLPEDALARVPDGVRSGCHRARGGGRESPHAPAELEGRPRAIAIGTFDGVHRGHRAVLEATLAAGGLPTAVTFHPHPRVVLGYQVDLLCTIERRLELLAAAGVEETLVVEFTPEVATLEPAAFVREYLAALGAEIVVAGEGFRFGRLSGGDLETIREELGIAAQAVPILDGVSSTASGACASGRGR